MFFSVKNNPNLPPLYPKVERQLPTAKDKGFDKVGGYTLREKTDLMPQPGLQEAFCACESNLIFLCGAATMGKTYGMYLKTLYGIDKQGFTSRMVSTRLQDSKKGTSMFRDAMEVCGTFAGCECSASDYPTFSWSQWNSNLQLIHINFNVDNPPEWSEFKEYIKKQQCSLMQIDEATNAKEKAITYMFSRNRDSSGMTIQMVLSFNPEHDHFTTSILRNAGYLTDDWFFDMKMNGATRYFYMKGDGFSDAIWGDSPEEVCRHAGIEISDGDRAAGLSEVDMVKSFTAFTGEASDNRKLVAATGGQSVANLHAVGATQRNVLKGAYFGALENTVTNVSREMIHQLWENPTNDDMNMYLTGDISLGKKTSDNCPFIVWRGLEVVDICLYQSGEPIVDFIERTLNRYNIPICNFAYDATGVGGLLEQHLKQGAIGVTANRRCLQEYDQHGNPILVDEYFNLRSQLLGKLEALFKRGEITMGVPKTLRLNYGKGDTTRSLVDILFDEMNVFITTSRNKKIYYRSKDEYRVKFKSSPDLMDAISLRMIFELDTRQRKQPKAEVQDDAYDALFQSYGGKRMGVGYW